MIHRRQLLTGLVGLIAAPAVVRASSLMPVRALPLRPIYGMRFDISDLDRLSGIDWHPVPEELLKQMARALLAIRDATPGQEGAT